jgi:hypothetical protein
VRPVPLIGRRAHPRVAVQFGRLLAPLLLHAAAPPPGEEQQREHDEYGDDDHDPHPRIHVGLFR